MPNASGVITASFADMLGMSGPITVPDAMIAAVWALNVAGNLLRTTCAMRVVRPLAFIPTPKPNAANKSHHVSPANDANTVSIGMPATAMNSTAMMSAVTISGNTRSTHHTIAHSRIPSACAACAESPADGSASAAATPTTTPAAAPTYSSLFLVLSAICPATRNIPSWHLSNTAPNALPSPYGRRARNALSHYPLAEDRTQSHLALAFAS